MSLTKEEEIRLNNLLEKIGEAEMSQVQDLASNCDISFQFAKTHSIYVKDWEQTKQKMLDDLKNGKIPEGSSPEFFQALIDNTEKIMQNKLSLTREIFQQKFGESIYNYLGEDGKTKKLFGLFG